MDYLQTSFWDTDPSLQSSGTTTPPNASEPEQRTDGSQGCECTTETCGCSIHPNTPAEWTASMQDSLARIFQSPVLAQALAESEAAYGPKSSGSLAHYDRENCSWKTAQQSLLWDLTEYSETWPTWGMTQDGVFYPLPPLAPRTYALDGGALRDVPTVTVHGNYNRKGASQHSGDGLATWAKSYGTTGQLSPDWVEWLMGWPIGHTELKHWVTGKSRSKLPQPTCCSVAG